MIDSAGLQLRFDFLLLLLLLLHLLLLHLLLFLLLCFFHSFLACWLFIICLDWLLVCTFFICLYFASFLGGEGESLNVVFDMKLSHGDWQLCI